MNSNVVRVAPRPKNPSTYQLNNNTSNNYKFTTTTGTNATSANVAALPNSQSSPSTNNFYTAASNNNNFSNFVSYPNYMNSNKMVMGNGGPILNHYNGVSATNGVGGIGVDVGGVSSGGFISNSENNSKFFTNLNSHHNNKTTSSSFNPFLIKKTTNKNSSISNNNCDTQNHPQMDGESLAVAVVASDKKYNSLKSNGIKKSPQFYSMRVNKCRRHHSRGGNGDREERGDGNKLNTLPYIADVQGDLEQPVYENLTDSIQIHESSYGYEPERMSIYRSDSGISNSSYDCITPVPAPRTVQRNCQSAPVYMNVPNSSSHSKNGYYHHHRGHHNVKCKQSVGGGGGGGCSGASALQNGIGAFVNFEVRFDKHFQSNEN